jgi:hypothetical protein
VGGRYSALSYFGLVPACVLGVDAALLLGRSAEMAQRCRASAPVTENPGLVLGALLGAAALSGRDKLTLETSPGIESFGLWVEQLIAESTGKDGTGIVPIVGEPRLEPRRFGEDRLFAACVLEGDDDLLQRAASLAAAGQPVVTLRLRDAHDLGGEMFRWEYATAVAGHLLGIHPFDQPNVESAKKKARSILETLARREAPPAIPEEDPLPALARARSGSTIGFMVFGDPRPELESALDELRAALVETRGVATTVGFGPRFLHSTGQLHKGGPRDALFVQLLLEEAPLPIPGEAFGFEALLAAQAAGDWLALRDAGRSVIRAPRTKSPVDAIRTWTTRLRSLRR